MRLIDCSVLARAPVSFAVLASGSGSNFEALVHASRASGFPGAIRLLLCDQPDAGALERARRLGIAAECPPCGPLRSRIVDELPWLERLREHRIDALLLAGFMRRVHAPMLEAFAGRMLNIHPSLVPAFPGLRAIERAFEHGVRLMGCTVHVVSDELDGGSIVGQRAFEVRDGESLGVVSERMHEAEHALYPECVTRYFATASRLEGRRLMFEGATRNG